MNDLVSVIVPIYKVEKYLKRCIDSILSQTYRCLEIILVNDGSPDECPIICDTYSTQDSRIRVIHKQNGGLSDARNAGIDIAKGKYITFIDSDDYVHPLFIEILLELIIKENGDISQCGYKRVDDSFNVDKLTIEDRNFKIYSGKRALYPDIYKTVAWSKLYKIELFKNICYPIGKLHEDEATTYKLFYNADKIVITDSPLYYYYMSPTSITRSKYTLKSLDIISILEEKCGFFKEKKEEALYNYETKRYCSILLGQYYLCKKNFPESKKIQKELFDKYKKNCVPVLRMKEIKLASKIFMIPCRVFPSLYGTLILDNGNN